VAAGHAGTRDNAAGPPFRAEIRAGLLLAECCVTPVTPCFQRTGSPFMRNITSIFCALALVAGCDKNDAASQGAQTSATGVAADNTEKNERDRSVNALTPTDQGESEADRTLTQRVRQDVMKQDDLSVNAKNVKIITQNGVVTLRGPVESAQEKSAIVRTASGVSGVQRVNDQLEVAGGGKSATALPSSDPADKK
jgi:hyperosmotically inducible periplasmic protein